MVYVWFLFFFFGLVSLALEIGIWTFPGVFGPRLGLDGLMLSWQVVLGATGTTLDGTGRPWGVRGLNSRLRRVLYFELFCNFRYTYRSGITK